MALFLESGIVDMAPRGRRMPRILLIYCEGKTEESYFNILLDLYHLPSYVEVEVYGQKGQHLTLIDNVASKREQLCQEEGLAEREVECWAVCDEDQMPCAYAGLLECAENRSVHLAFSAPQFEVYLLQHFEQSGDTDKPTVFQKLGVYRESYGYSKGYDDSTKADLAWIYEAIDRRPKIVKTAIINASLRDRASKRPFLTVQELTKRILELSV